MADHISKGEEFEKKAEKKLSGWVLFGSKHEDAAELYEKAANSFKLAKSCTFLFFVFNDRVFWVDGQKFELIAYSFADYLLLLNLGFSSV